MDQTNTTRLKIVIGSLHFEYEGSETFLQAEALKLVQAMYILQRSTLSISASILQNTIQEAQSVQGTLGDSMSALKSEVDALSEMSEEDMLRLQMAMDRESKLVETLSNIMKKISDTADGIAQNLK